MSESIVQAVLRLQQRVDDLEARLIALEAPKEPLRIDMRTSLGRAIKAHPNG